MINCRRFLGWFGCGLAFVLSTSLSAVATEPAQPALKLQNRYVRLELSADGRCRQFTARAGGTNYCAQPTTTSFASVKKAGRMFPGSSATFANGKLTVNFGEADVTAMIEVTSKKNYFIFEVAEVRGDGVEELVFADFPLTLKAEPDEPFAACALALNLQTNVRDIPGASKRLWAACYSRFGLVGAKVALIGCPTKTLREIMKEVVSAAPDLPHSPIGGPWALDAESNRGSYVFSFGDLPENKVDEWIAFARSIGVTEIDFHGGSSFRFGDCVPNPHVYPKGWASFKAVINKLHAAGLKAGLHTYAQFIEKTTPWVTPVPDPRLGKDATFTLAQPLTANSNNVFVTESTTNMSAITGPVVRNSVTLQIDDELIIYTGVAKEPPYAFTGCQRGANGTRVAAHTAGAKVHHLKECFGLFTADGDSTLYTEIAAKTAEAFNTGGFDMIYLDALDGSDIFGGPENAWYYQSKFTFEIWKRLKKPALIEMSTFSHHLWFLRSRMGAWDHPRRGYKRFVDLHVAANADNQRMFLPGQLGWWSVQTWYGAQETSFTDDVEYLMAKCLGTDTGSALQGMNPFNTATNFAFPRLAKIMRQYETLRHANYFSDAVKAKLRVPGEEFTLFQNADGEWQFRRTQYDRHKVEGLDGWSDVWTVSNRFAPQPLQLRIEALMSAGSYDSPSNITLLDFGDGKDFSDPANQSGVAGQFSVVTEPLKVGRASGCFTATNSTTSRRGAWAKVGKTFEPPLDLTGKEGLGVWVHGDGKGETLNIQLNSPVHLMPGIADHYVVVDFTGWRYFELIESEADRFADYVWPYGGAYNIYREAVHHSAISGVNFYYNNLPPDGTATCYLSPIRTLPVIKGRWRNPSITIGGRTVTFPVEMESGSCLEFRSPTDCKLYGQNGALLAEVKPQGDVPVLDAGPNRVEFRCNASAGPSPRAYVTAIAEGQIVRGVNPRNKLKAVKNAR